MTYKFLEVVKTRFYIGKYYFLVPVIPYLESSSSFHTKLADASNRLEISFCDCYHLNESRTILEIINAFYIKRIKV